MPKSQCDVDDVFDDYDDVHGDLSDDVDHEDLVALATTLVKGMTQQLG